VILAIGDIFDFIRNGMSVKQSSDIDGLPITRIETIWNAEIDLSRVGYAGVQFANAKDYLLKDGDILFSHINSVAHIGKCALYSQSHGELVHGMNLLCFRPNQTKILPKYALYTLRSNQFKDQLARSIKKAVNQASVTIGDIKKIQIEIPPLAEQQRIASILDKADLIKRKREFNIEKLGLLAGSIFLEMFGNPNINNKNLRMQNLGEILKVKSGNFLPNNAMESDGKYPE
jgi:type I restriction enzyme, S subunit